MKNHSATDDLDRFAQNSAISLYERGSCKLLYCHGGEFQETPC